MTTARVLTAIPTLKFSRFNHRQTKLNDTFDMKAFLATIGCQEAVEIDFSSNYLDIEAAKALAEWLESGAAPKCTILLLDANQFNDEAAKLLAEASSSPKAPAILTIDLGCNKITDVGAQYWAQAFQDGKSKLTLGLSSNSITEVGALALEEAKKSATRSIDLNLEGNLLDVAKRDQERKECTSSVENFRHRAVRF